MADVNVRVMVPRVRRALEGLDAPSLTDDQVKDAVADACADVILYTGSLFGGQLVVLAVDPDTGAPAEYGTSAALTLAQQSVIATQAALTYFFFLFAGLKVSEKIGDEGSSWEYSLSANLLRDQLKQLQAERDKALDAAAVESGATLERYSSYVAERDVWVARLVEPWTEGLAGIGGQQVC